MIVFREVVKEDHLEFCETLKVLTEVGDIAPSQFSELVDFWHTNPAYHVIVAVNDENKVIATGTLFVEQKLIHSCGKVGHIEDIAVSKSAQGQSLGKQMIQYLTEISQKAGCYKTILDCDEKNVKFYEKCGYSTAGIEMSIRY